MQANIRTMAFNGIDTIDIDVQVHLSNGLPGMAIVGLADKAVAESKERVRAALSSIGLSMPPKRVAINLAPADLSKEGSHYDLPIALGLMVAMGVVPQDSCDGFCVMGELSLDGTITHVTGVLPAAIGASEQGYGLICPQSCGNEAAFAGEIPIIAAPSLTALVAHLRGDQVLSLPEARLSQNTITHPDMADLAGQMVARRVLEITAAGGHNMLMIGPPGAGKSMLAARLPGLLPGLTAREALEVTMIHSVAGTLNQDGLMWQRPFRDPHHSASVAALVGGGMKARPGEVSLAHGGILFLDELAEWQRPHLDALRQTVESGKAVVSRANHHATYPAHFQLIAAMNPCRCGYLSDAARACSRAPLCSQQYLSKISGPMLDRFDVMIEVPEVPLHVLTNPERNESSAEVLARVMSAREIAGRRPQQKDTPINAQIAPDQIDDVVQLDDRGKKLVTAAAEKQALSARGYHRVLRVARTIADLAGDEVTRHDHLAEALQYRRAWPQ
ncbi:MAG: YifB family Mg chelatase-like AAA ATPase [Alphaproteobacteria bacterium]|nr:YifB family Mg chelatase-like AAA ATPase [Alphaproteobacteria bacterium]